MVNYVICCWSGGRRAGGPRGEYYLEKHLESLANLRHTQISQITVMIPHNDYESSSYTRVVENMPLTLNGVPIHARRRLNRGMSYGSFSDAYRDWRDTTPYYMFMEDDYVFTTDDFDIKMIELIGTEEDRVGYVCGMAYALPGIYPWHAGMSCGLLRSRALLDVWNHNGMLPHDPSSSNYITNQDMGQVGFSQAMMRWNWSVIDVSSKYHIDFREQNWAIVKHGNPGHPIIMRPLG